MTIWRQRLQLGLYRTVFQRISALVPRHGLIDAYAAGVDYSIIKANVSLRCCLARKDSGATYLVYKPEHVMDLITSAMLGAPVYPVSYLLAGNSSFNGWSAWQDSAFLTDC